MGPAGATICVVLLTACLAAGAARTLSEAEQHLELKEQQHRELKTSDPCSAFGGKKRTALLVADPGDFTGSAEAKYFQQLLSNNFTSPEGETVCGSKSYGTILGQDVLLVTTGIGPMTAALCVSELLQCAKYIKEIVYQGTSGWSTQKGGVLNGGSCGAANPASQVVLYGDVCVSPFSINWECQQTDWTQQCNNFPDVCTYPEDTLGPTASFLYGKCIFPTPSNGSMELTDEILGVVSNAAASAPKRSDKLKALESEYYDALSNGTSLNYAVSLDGPPSIYDYRVCSEVDGQFFYSGVPWDMSARNFTAVLINEALNTTLTQRDVIAVAAMEGIGVNYAMFKYNSLSSTTRQVPYTIVRSASDRLHAPVAKQADGTWRQVEVTVDFPTGYAYAIATASNLVLTWLQQRCYQALGQQNQACTFSVQL